MAFFLPAAVHLTVRRAPAPAVVKSPKVLTHRRATRMCRCYLARGRGLACVCDTGGPTLKGRGRDHGRRVVVRLCFLRQRRGGALQAALDVGTASRTRILHRALAAPDGTIVSVGRAVWWRRSFPAPGGTAAGHSRVAGRVTAARHGPDAGFVRPAARRDAALSYATPPLLQRPGGRDPHVR